MATFKDHDAPVKGTIKITDIDFRFYIDCTQDAAGKEFPHTAGNFMLSGINLSGGLFNKADIRLLDPQHIVTNPTSSAEVIRVELPKADYELLKDLFQKSFVAPPEDQQEAPVVLMHYQSVSQSNRFNVSFRVNY